MTVSDSSQDSRAATHVLLGVWEYKYVPWENVGHHLYRGWTVPVPVRSNWDTLFMQYTQWERKKGEHHGRRTP